MAAVVTPVVRTRVDKNFKVYTTVALDSSYPTGGEAITANAVGLGTILMGYSPGTTSGYLFQWDNTNSKLLAYYADYDAVADGALIQVPNTTDLSALTAVPLILIGT